MGHWPGPLGFCPFLGWPVRACGPPPAPTVFRLRPGGFLWISAIRRTASDSKSVVFYFIFGFVVISITFGLWYLSGIYFTVVSFVSRPSPMLPHSATEMTLSLCRQVFGWVFEILLISVLAAWLVDTKDRGFVMGNLAAGTQMAAGLCRRHAARPWSCTCCPARVASKRTSPGHLGPTIWITSSTSG